MSKTRALGLSNLVVTSFDKASEEELEQNKWQVPKALPQFDLLKFQPVVISPQLLALQALLCGEFSTATLATSAQDPMQMSFASALPLLHLKNFGPKPLKKQGKAPAYNPFKKVNYSKRFYVLEQFVLKISKQEGEKPYKQLNLEDIESMSFDLDALTCQIESSKSGSSKSDLSAKTWRFSFNSEAELVDFTSHVALRIIIHMLFHEEDGDYYHNLSQLVSLAQPHLEIDVLPNTPLVLLSMKHPALACEILKRDVNSSCLLRPNVLAKYPVQQVLQSAGRDLNIVGDDVEFALTLLHFYILTRRVDDMGALLTRIDLPSAQIKTKTGETPLSLAIKTCAKHIPVLLQMVSMLLAFGINPDETCASGDSAYHLALKLQLDPVCVALEQYCDINMLDARGDSPLHIALRSKNIKAAKRMLGDLRLDWEQHDQQDNNALLLAMKLNEESFAIALLNRKQPPQRRSKSLPTPLNIGTSSSSSPANDPQVKRGLATRSSDIVVPYLLPIHLAIKLHQPSLSLVLVDMLSCEELGLKDTTGRTCLQLAILHSLLGVTFALINKLSQVAPHLLQVQDEATGDDALLLAIRAGRVDVATALLCNDQLKRNAYNGQTALHASVRLVERTYHHAAQSLAAVGLLQRIVARCERSAEEINACTLGGNRDSVLHWAVRCKDEACGMWIVEALLKHPKLSFEVLDVDGWTPLALAIALQKWELCQILIPKSKLDRTLGPKGRSYVHLLVDAMRDQTGAVRVMDMLLAHGVYCGEWDADGMTPLHLACIAKSPSLALETMLRNDEVCRKRLNDRTELGGLTPLLLCFAHKVDFDRIDMLLENGADYRLLEPRTRLGVFQHCEMLDMRDELFEILSRWIPSNATLGECEREAKLAVETAYNHERENLEHFLSTEQGEKLLQRRAEEIQEENPLCPLEAAMEIARTSLFTLRGVSRSDYNVA